MMRGSITEDFRKSLSMVRNRFVFDDKTYPRIGLSFESRILFLILRILSGFIKHIFGNFVKNVCKILELCYTQKDK